MCNNQIKILTKANNDLISFCKCEDSAIATSGQVDCPWCGCGWLFICLKCSKAFTFATVTETTRTYTEISQELFLNQFNDKLSQDDENVQGQAEWMRSELENIPLGTKCVILDGKILPISSQSIEFVGWHSHHKFDTVPHLAANTDQQLIASDISQEEYWRNREVFDTDIN